MPRGTLMSQLNVMTNPSNSCLTHIYTSWWWQEEIKRSPNAKRPLHVTAQLAWLASNCSFLVLHWQKMWIGHGTCFSITFSEVSSQKNIYWNVDLKHCRVLIGQRGLATKSSLACHGTSCTNTFLNSKATVNSPCNSGGYYLQWSRAKHDLAQCHAVEIRQKTVGFILWRP